MKYSQNDEEIHILEHFKNQPSGRFLDIGAYTGKELSNTYALVQLGWAGVCVEASPQCFVQLQKNYLGNDKISLVNAAISDKSRIIEFYDSGGAVATLHAEHYDTWKEHQLDFQKIYVASIQPSEIFRAFGFKFDFISIDIEGHDWPVLRQLPLEQIGASLICIEYGKDLEAIYSFLLGFGYKSIYENGENILCKKV